MTHLMLLMDISPDPTGASGWGVLILLLLIVMILAVGFAGGLVFLLIWLKRRKTNDVEKAQPERVTA